MTHPSSNLSPWHASYLVKPTQSHTDTTSIRKALLGERSRRAQDIEMEIVTHMPKLSLIWSNSILTSIRKVFERWGSGLEMWVLNLILRIFFCLDRCPLLITPSMIPFDSVRCVLVRLLAYLFFFLLFLVVCLFCSSPNALLTLSKSLVIRLELS